MRGVARVRRSIAGLGAVVLLLGSMRVALASDGAVAPQLMAQVQAQGTARVIVGLRVPTSPEAQLGSSLAVMGQRRAIVASQSSVLTALAGTLARAVWEYETIPFVALEVGPDALAALERSPAVMSVEEDRLAAPTLAQSGPIVEADQAWASGFDGTGWTVAVVDTGVDGTHTFLAGEVVEEACFASGGCPNGQTAQTGAGAGVPCAFAAQGCRHGTHVAGIAAGRGATVSGIARGAAIASIQVFSEFSGANCIDAGEDPCPRSYTSDQMKALEYIYNGLRTSRQIAAVNMSIGGIAYASQASCDGANAGMKMAIDNLRAAGIATVIASGNEGYLGAVAEPGCISSAVSVGATTKSDAVSTYTNSASFLSLLAPGTSINSSVPGGAFAVFSGTSMATPHVAGAWAILKQRKPAATVGELLTLLQTTGLPIPRAGSATTPRIRITQALNALAGCTYSISPVASALGSGPQTGTVSVTAGDGCSWTAFSRVSWLSVTAGASGTGNGTVSYAVEANTGTSTRTGMLTIAGRVFTVTQAGVSGPTPTETRTPTPTPTATPTPTRTPTPTVTRTPGACTPGSRELAFPPALTAAPNAIVAIPLTIDNGAGILGIDVVTRYAPSVITPQDPPVRVVGAASTAGCSVASNGATAGVVTATLFCTAPITEGGPVLEFDFQVIGTPGAASPLALSECALNEGELPCCPVDGRLSVIAAVPISGRVTYFGDSGIVPPWPHGGRPVPATDVTLRTSCDGAERSASTNAGGDFRFDDVPTDCTVRAQPAKNDCSDGGISALDAALCCQFVVGIATPTLAQQLACDVTGNGSVSALDCSEIARKRVGLLACFSVATACGSDFTFIPEPRPLMGQTLQPPSVGPLPAQCPGRIIIAALANPAADQDFVAVKFGDPTGNWGLASTSAVAGRESRTTATRVWLGRARRMRNGEIRIPVLLHSHRRVHGIDVTLEYDPVLLYPVGIVAGSGRLTTVANTGVSGVLRLSAFSPSGVRRARVAVLRFVATPPGAARQGGASVRLQDASADERALRVSARGEILSPALDASAEPNLRSPELGRARRGRAQEASAAL